MTRESKIGLVVAASFISLVGGVLTVRFMHPSPEPPPQVVANPPGIPLPPDMSDSSETESPAPAKPDTPVSIEIPSTPKPTTPDTAGPPVLAPVTPAVAVDAAPPKIEISLPTPPPTKPETVPPAPPAATTEPMNGGITITPAPVSPVSPTPTPPNDIKVESATPEPPPLSRIGLPPAPTDNNNSTTPPPPPPVRPAPVEIPVPPTKPDAAKPVIEPPPEISVVPAKPTPPPNMALEPPPVIEPKPAKTEPLPMKPDVKPIIPTNDAPPPVSLGTPAPAANVDSHSVSPATGPVNTDPRQDSYEEEWYRCQSDETLESISQKIFFTTKYAQALRLYNLDRQFSENLRQENPVLRAGQTIRIPPVRILERGYSGSASGLKAASTPRSASPGGMAPEKPGVAPISASDINGPREYRVRGSDKTLRDIAKEELGNSNDWYKIFQMNRWLNPNEPVPEGATIYLPRTATRP